MLPPKLPKKPKRESRWRSQAHCNYIRQHHCSIAGCMALPIEVAHVRIGSGAGVGQRPHDYFAISLCRTHHAEQHNTGEASFEKRYNISMMELADGFAKTSPKASEIRIAKNAG